MQVQAKKLNAKKLFKVGFVGPSKPKWKNPEQYQKMEEKIREIILLYISSMENPRLDGKLVIVSGHCPVGKERYYCLDCQMFISDEYLEWHKQNNTNGIIKVYDQGGVDTEAEIIAHQLGCKTEIYPAPAKQWNDKKVETFIPNTLMPSECPMRVKLEFDKLNLRDKKISRIRKSGIVVTGKRLGYRSRNIQIAKAVDVLYCIVPNVLSETDRVMMTKNNDLDTFYAYKNRKDIACSHCKIIGHPQNGGCYTKVEAEKLGKETHLVVIP